MNHAEAGEGALTSFFSKRDAVALLGGALGTLSLAAGWLTLRPNRLANGVSFNLWQLDLVVAVLFAAAWGITLLVTVIGPDRVKSRSTTLGVLGNVLLLGSVLLVGLESRHILQGQPNIARASLGGGFWVSVAGAGVLIFAGTKGMSGWCSQLAQWSGVLGSLVALGTGWLNSLSILVEYQGYEARFWQEAAQHVRLCGISVGIAAISGFILGVWAYGRPVVRGSVFFLASTIQTVPSLALFGFLIAPLSALTFAYPALRSLGITGIGTTPAIIALTLYSLLPVIQNTYIGMKQVDPAALDAGLGMGMSRGQVFRQVQLPLAMPVIMEGVRTASVQAVGLTTVAGIIGAGGFGWFVFRGIGQAAPDLILLGAIPVIGLALIVDFILRGAVRAVTPRGVIPSEFSRMVER